MKPLIINALTTLFFLVFLSQQGSSQPDQSIDGRDVTYVKFSDLSGNPVGTFVQRLGQTQWEEEGLTQGVARFTFQQVRRTPRSIYLHDASRAVDIRLDVPEKKVMYKDRSDADYRQIYAITQSYMMTGWNLTTANYTALNGTEVIGHLFKTNIPADSKVWNEYDPAKSKQVGNFVELPDPEATFQEYKRDEFSVYLHDASRDVYLRIDLYLNKVMFKQGSNGTYRPQYEISWANFNCAGLKDSPDPNSTNECVVTIK